MYLSLKLSLLLICITATGSEHTEEVLKCNIRYCGAELLNFEKFSFAGLFRKMEIASFCIKNCTPPIVHEFFQSIIYGITKRIPGHCSGEACIDKNRFVALAKCVEDQAWPLVQCTKHLIDLAHIGLVTNPDDLKRNTTCSIAVETVQCIEETLQACGERPFHLMKEILGDLIKIGITAYCHPSYRNEGLFVRKVTATTISGDDSHLISGEDNGYTYKHPQYVKGYKRNDAFGHPTLSFSCMLSSIIFSTVFSFQYFQQIG